jgi:hypothetical protein
MEIRFSRHAKNKLRLYRLTADAVEEVIRAGKRQERQGKFDSVHANLKVIWVFVASYAFVITVIRTR